MTAGSGRRPTGRDLLAVLVMALVLAACAETGEGNPMPSPTTAEQDRTETTLDIDRMNMDAGWQVCSHDPEQVYAEAGTRDPVAAAEWYGQGTVERIRWASVHGCLAGLLGEPNPAER